MKGKYFIGGLALVCLLALGGRMALEMGERKPPEPQEIVDPVTWNLPESELRRLGYYQKPFHPGVWYSPGEYTLNHFWPRSGYMYGQEHGHGWYGDMFATIKHGIDEAIARGDFNVEDFEKLDFSLPGEPGYGDNPKLEVFNPNGPFKAPLFKGHIIHPQDFKESTEPDSRVMFVRVRQKFGEDSGLVLREYIYGVVTHIKAEVCEDKSAPLVIDNHAYSSASIDKILKSTTDSFINLNDMGLPEIKKGITGLPLSSCVKDSSDKWFYFGYGWIAMRELVKGETKWRM